METIAQRSKIQPWMIVSKIPYPVFCVNSSSPFTSQFFSPLWFLQCLPSHPTSPDSPHGVTCSLICAPKAFCFFHKSPFHIILYSSSLFDLQINWGLLSLFTLDTFPVPHMNSISEFHSLNHLADDLSGSAMCWRQWETHHVVRPRSYPQREALGRLGGSWLRINPPL